MIAEAECPECKSGTLESVDGELRCRGECGGIFKPDLLDDTTQFARLLSAIQATGVFEHNPLNADLLASMDLTADEVDSLFKRADRVWDAAQETIKSASEIGYYRALEAELVAMRLASGGLETDEEEDLNDQLMSAWYLLSAAEQEAIRAEGPKTLIKESK